MSRSPFRRVASVVALVVLVSAVMVPTLEASPPWLDSGASFAPPAVDQSFIGAVWTWLTGLWSSLSVQKAAPTTTTCDPKDPKCTPPGEETSSGGGGGGGGNPESPIGPGIDPSG